MEPSLVAGACVWPRCFVDRQSIMNMVPIFGCCVGRIDAERLDTIDQLQNPFDLRPAGQPQQTLTPRCDPGYSRIALPWYRRAQNIDARQDGPKVILAFVRWTSNARRRGCCRE